MLEINKIHNMDCIEGLKKLPDRSVDLVLTDPPYGVIGMEWDKHINWDELAKEIYRVLKVNGSISPRAYDPNAKHVSPAYGTHVGDKGKTSRMEKSPGGKKVKWEASDVILAVGIILVTFSYFVPKPDDMAWFIISMIIVVSGAAMMITEYKMGWRK